MIFSPEKILAIQNLLSPEAKICITTHYNPDGDAIGSSMGLYHLLKNLGHSPQVVVPNDFPKFLKWMPSAKKAIIFEYKKANAAQIIADADILFCLDYNDLSRTGNLGPLIEKAKAKKILIDHHQQPGQFDYTFSDTGIPATCQLVVHFAHAMGWKDKINKEVAECLYTGIMTDTGGFRYRNTNSQTHLIIAELIDLGAEPATISSNTWDNNTLERLKLLSVVLGRIELTGNGKVAILYLKREELEKYGFSKGDTDGIVNYGLSLSGVEMAAFFSEDLYEDYIKISFRSKTSWDVNKFSRTYYQGGGHINAAGGKSYEELNTCLENFKDNIILAMEDGILI